MLKINFTKMHGLGNDFVIIDARNQQLKLTVEQIKLICDRKLGIGCDQLLIIRNNVENSPDYDYIYQIFNSDGTEVEQCGNGARCCIKYLIDSINLVDSSNYTFKKQIRLKSMNRIITGYTKTKDIIAVDLGIPEFFPDAKYGSITYGVVSVGNPHAIIKLNTLDELSDITNLTKIAKSIQKSKDFPNSVNVNFYVMDNDESIHLRTNERGCGFTNACGTGAAATTCYSIKCGLLKSSVVVHMPGGDLTINWTPPDGEIIMSGTATKVFSGSIEV